MNQQMTIEQAVQLIEQATEMLQLKRSEHAAIAVALNTIKQATAKADAPDVIE